MIAPSCRGTILLVSHVLPSRPAAGNEQRIFKLVRWLRTQGFKIVLLATRPQLSATERSDLGTLFDHVHDLAESKLQRLVARLSRDDRRQLPGHAHPLVRALSPPALLRATRRLCSHYRPRILIAEYIFSAPCLLAAPPGCLRLIDTHDVFSQRETGDHLYCPPELEASLLKLADVVLAIQPEETRTLSRLVPDRKVITVGVDYEPSPTSSSVTQHEPTLLVVGSDNAANIEGLRQFLEHVWPRVHALHPAAKLRIVGSLGRTFHATHPGIETPGRVPDLRAEYEQATLVLNPTLTGTGLKIKTIEALAHGKALVATPNAAEGLAGDPTPCAVCGDWQSFTTEVLHLLQNPLPRKFLEEVAIEYCHRRLNHTAAYSELAHTLKHYPGR
jgi:hypothetical protein